jgi:hypothetical protein
MESMKTNQREENNMKKSKHNKSIEPKGIYHYTTIWSLMGIEEQRGLIPSEPWEDFLGERAVWLSTNPHWESSVRKRLVDQDGKQSVPLTREGLWQMGYHPVRIEVNPERLEIIRWEEIPMLFGLNGHEFRALEHRAVATGGNPSEWCMCFGFIPLATCHYPPEIWDGTRWSTLWRMMALTTDDIAYLTGSHADIGVIADTCSSEECLLEQGGF